MGVTLTPITIRHPTSLESLRGRTIAIDGNLELYQFLSIMRTHDGQPLHDSAGRITSHLNGLAFRTTRLIADYDIRPVFVEGGRAEEWPRAIRWGAAMEPVEVLRSWIDERGGGRRRCFRIRLDDGSVLDISRPEPDGVWTVDRERDERA